jgi:hypothetical protein
LSCLGSPLTIPSHGLPLQVEWAPPNNIGHNHTPPHTFRSTRTIETTTSSEVGPTSGSDVGTTSSSDVGSTPSSEVGSPQSRTVTPIKTLSHQSRTATPVKDCHTSRGLSHQSRTVISVKVCHSSQGLSHQLTLPCKVGTTLGCVELRSSKRPRFP